MGSRRHSTTVGTAQQAGEPLPGKTPRLDAGWFAVSPSAVLLLIWMIAPLGMSRYFSLIVSASESDVDEQGSALTARNQRVA